MARVCVMTGLLVIRVTLLFRAVPIIAQATAFVPMGNAIASPESGKAQLVMLSCTTALHTSTIALVTESANQTTSSTLQQIGLVRVMMDFVEMHAMWFAVIAQTIALVMELARTKLVSAKLVSLAKIVLTLLLLTLVQTTVRVMEVANDKMEHSLVYAPHVTVVMIV